MAHNTLAKPTEYARKLAKKHKKVLPADDALHVEMSQADKDESALREITASEEKTAREKDLAENGHKYARAAEFKKIPQGDQNDEIWRALDALFTAAGIQMPETVKAMADRLKAVKTNNPAPVKK